MPEFLQYLKNGQCQWSRIAWRLPSVLPCGARTHPLPIRIGGATCTSTGTFPEADRKQEADYGCDALALQ